MEEVVQEPNYPSVHLVKIDLEGAEKLVLDGMRELRNPCLKPIVELVSNKFNLEELLDALRS